MLLNYFVLSETVQITGCLHSSFSLGFWGSNSDLR